MLVIVDSWSNVKGRIGRETKKSTKGCRAKVEGTTKTQMTRRKLKIESETKRKARKASEAMAEDRVESPRGSHSANDFRLDG